MQTFSSEDAFFLIPWFGSAHQPLFLPVERNLPVWPELLFQLQHFPDASKCLLWGLSAAWTRQKNKLKPFFWGTTILTFLCRRSSQHLLFGGDVWIIYCSHLRSNTWAFWTYTSTPLHWPSLYAHIHQADRGQRLTWMLDLFRPCYL